MSCFRCLKGLSTTFKTRMLKLLFSSRTCDTSFDLFNYSLMNQLTHTYILALQISVISLSTSLYFLFCCVLSPQPSFRPAGCSRILSTAPSFRLQPLVDLNVQFEANIKQDRKIKIVGFSVQRYLYFFIGVWRYVLQINTMYHFPWLTYHSRTIFDSSAIRYNTIQWTKQPGKKLVVGYLIFFCWTKYLQNKCNHLLIRLDELWFNTILLLPLSISTVSKNI